MAASMSPEASVRKKLMKKLNKLEKNLSSKENIEISKRPCRVLCVQNGGLGNSVSQDELMSLFTSFGEVEGIVMIPRKQYCFISFTDVTSASHAFEQLNGHLLRKGKDPSQDVILYLFYVEKAPPSAMSGSERPLGLHIVEDFVSEETEQALLDLVDMSQLNDIDQGVTGAMKHRQVKHFGYEFKYGINDVDVNEPLPDGIPSMCQEFLQRAQKLGLVGHIPDQLTVNQYKPGQGIPPHVDTPEAFEDGIMSLSLGSQAVMDFRHPDGRHLSVVIPQRSLLVMTGESRYVWSHGITPRKSDIVTTASGDGLTLQNRETRTSFTFRKVVMNRNRRKSEGGDGEASGRNLPQNDEEAVALEKQHVHKVYDDIADHFSGTRYKPWPRVVDFILEQPPMSLLADVGCGNGKCLGLNKELFEIGSDYSKNLASICHSRGFETCVADVTCLPFRSSSFDIVLCIAVIHHMATKARRHKAVSEVIRILRRGGKALIYVWAMEQDLNKTPSKYISHSKQKKQVDVDIMAKDNSAQAVSEFTSTEARGSDSEKSEQFGGNDRNERKDSFHGAGEAKMCKECVSYDFKEQSSELLDQTAHLSALHDSSNTGNIGAAQTISVRHKEREEFNTDTPHSLGSESENRSIPDGDDFSEACKSALLTKRLHVHVNRTQFREQDLLVPWQLKCKQAGHEEKLQDGGTGETKPNVFHRFYHVFRQGELEAVCKKVPECVVRKSYYDQGNWCVVLEKL